MKDNFFDFYNVYSDLYNKTVEYETFVPNARASSNSLIINQIGRNVLEKRHEMERAKKEFDESYGIEKLAYDAFMDSYEDVLPDNLVTELRKRGHDVRSRREHVFTYNNLKRMIRDYMQCMQSSKKPYGLTAGLKVVIKGMNGYQLDADDVEKANDYLASFGSACQKLYKDQLNYVRTGYIDGRGDTTNSVKNETYVDLCCGGASTSKKD